MPMLSGVLSSFKSTAQLGYICMYQHNNVVTVYIHRAREHTWSKQLTLILHCNFTNVSNSISGWHCQFSGVTRTSTRTEPSSTRIWTKDNSYKQAQGIDRLPLRTCNLQHKCYRQLGVQVQPREVITSCVGGRHNMPPPLSSPGGRLSASRAAEQTQRSSTFPRRISHVDHCSRLAR